MTASKVNTRAFKFVANGEARARAALFRRKRPAIADLPFALGDATAGTENEWQCVVIGAGADVDLPQTILDSRYYQNLTRRVGVGETALERITRLRLYLAENKSEVWENSWVRFPQRVLCRAARRALEDDLSIASNLSDAPQPVRAPRSDGARFIYEAGGETFVRVPISYLLKLALVDFVGRHLMNDSDDATDDSSIAIEEKRARNSTVNFHPPSLGASPDARRLRVELRQLAARLTNHFLNDLISPETFSFYVVRAAAGESLGGKTAREMAQRFLFAHLLVEWANKSFALETTGQRALIYSAPHTPVRQKELNECISDAFFRELFINPCLSGFADSEAKRDYMHLAHQIVSRSQLNALAKLREAGIIANNLVVLPNTSNVSLANNGTHLSLGSLKLSAALASSSDEFTPRDEKHTGDLVIKICEHFLPLFVATYTAAPFRFAFEEFHPETMLGFLPHELDYTHLRMLWRNWRRKADIRIFKRPRTPSGLSWLDALIARLFRLGGDFVPDVRLIDYPMAWLATENCSALDGALGNIERLKADLETMGVADRRLKLYQLIALRSMARVGFSGFEARHYSAFCRFQRDFARVADLQRLIIVLAFKYVRAGILTHADLPDDPTHESERRQPFFCAALGLPVFYVNIKTRNAFLRRLLPRMRETRHGAIRFSRRHAGYVRVPLEVYLMALLELLQQEHEIAEMLDMKETLADLDARVRDARERVCSQLTRGIMETLGETVADPLKIEARRFNRAAEKYYRETLRREHLEEAFAELRAETARYLACAESSTHEVARIIFGTRDALAFLDQTRLALLDDKLSLADLRRLLFVMLGVIADTERETAPRRQSFV